MTIEIQTRIEGRRGCGFRKPGGIYLIGPATGTDCCKLPFPLTVCPCCGTGIKPSRSWTWVDVEGLFFPNGPTKHPDEPQCYACPLNDYRQIGKAGLIWIDEKFYPTPGDFLQEAREMGISRRLSMVPREFKAGETWVLLAHRKVCFGLQDGTETGLLESPAIFAIFRPKAIEYVVKGNETAEDLEKIVKRGLTPVRVNPARAYR